MPGVSRLAFHHPAEGNPRLGALRMGVSGQQIGAGSGSTVRIRSRATLAYAGIALEADPTPPKAFSHCKASRTRA